MNNNDVTLDDDYGGIIMNDGSIEYYYFNIPITVIYLRMVGSHAVFGFYRHFSSPFKQVREKFGIVCVLCAKSLDGTNYDQWTWLKCSWVITNNITNLI